MATTFIDTNRISPVPLGGHRGQCAEILNGALCGARNVIGCLRWLESGDSIEAANDAATHQLLYLMDGDAMIRLEGQDYAVGKGAGLYLGPSEAAIVRHTGSGPLKLFHLVVPKLPQIANEEEP